MSKARSKVSLHLPVKTISKAGEVFDPREDVWRFSSSSKYASINFATFKELATEAMVVSLKAAIAGAVRKLAPRTCVTMVEKAVIPLLKHAHARLGERVDNITLDMLQAFALSLDERHRHQLNFVKMLGRALAIHGNSEHAIETQALYWLERQKSVSNPKGEAALTMDPLKGPLLMSEDRVLMRSLHAAFEENQLPKHIYLKILLFRLSAMRPAQMADLKCKDLTFREGVYSLAFPQVKKRGEGWRESFEIWTLLPEVGALLEGFIREQQAKWAHLGMGGELPLFMNDRNKDPLRTYHPVGDCLVRELPHFLSNLKTLDPITRKVVKVRSPRTGEPFRVNMRRFRMSIATWALMRGGTLLEVAQILGHSVVSPSLNSYAAIDVALLEDMDRKMAVSENQTAGYFRGEFCSGSGIGGALYPESFGGLAVGRCKSICEQRKPFACYTCNQFQALMEGPHEQVLKDLISECEQVTTSGGTFQVDTHDQTIRAVNQVIAMRNEKLRKDSLSLAGHLSIEV
jgi:integrase